MLSSADFLFSKSTFSKNSSMNTIRVSNSLDPDQARHFVEPDLGPNCLQRLSADDTTRVSCTKLFVLFNKITNIDSASDELFHNHLPIFS